MEARRASGLVSQKQSRMKIKNRGGKREDSIITSGKKGKGIISKETKATASYSTARSVLRRGRPLREGYLKGKPRPIFAAGPL